VSLILEALKKSEQERRRDRGPDLQTIHPPVAGAAPARSRGALWLVLLVAVNAAALGAWWWQTHKPQPERAAAVAAAPATDTRPAPAEAAKQDSAPGSAEFTRMTPAPGSAPTPARLSPDRPLPVREVSELPNSVRDELPAMTFSFHVYSADPQKRTIIINNHRLREGDEVSAGVVLEEITDDGVILDKAPYRIHIGVLSGW
jgi:general secretion pathway protein B